MATLHENESGGLPTAAWPDTIAVVGVVLGLIGILGNVWNVLYPITRPALEGLTSSYGLRESLPPAAYVILSGVVEVGLSVLLITGSLRMKARRRSGAGVLRLWAVLSIPWGMIEVVAAGIITSDILYGSAYIGDHDATVQAATGLGLVLGLALALVCPVFVLIWLRRPVIAAQIRAWGD